MNVSQRPRTKEFCATMRDYIIDSDTSINFSVMFGGKIILDEEYAPDANYQIHIRKLGKFLSMALWGVWDTGFATRQSSAAGTFSFRINGVQDMLCDVTFSRMQTRKDAANPGWLSEANEKVTRSGATEYVSCICEQNEIVSLSIQTSEGVFNNPTFYTHSTAKSPVSLLVGTSVLKTSVTSLKGTILKYTLKRGDHIMTFLVDNTLYVEMQCFRYKNVYDMPETLTTVGGMTLKGEGTGDTAKMWGVTRKFESVPADEYTVNSGPIFLQSDYKLWHNFLNAQETEIYSDGRWIPIIITKQNYERSFNRSLLKAVEFSFELADNEQNNLIEP